MGLEQLDVYAKIINNAVGLSSNSPLFLKELSIQILKLSPEDQQIFFTKVTLASLALAVEGSEIVLQPDALDFLRSMTALNLEISNVVKKTISIGTRLEYYTWKAQYNPGNAARIICDQLNFDAPVSIASVENATQLRKAAIGCAALTVGVAGVACVIKYAGGNSGTVPTVSIALNNQQHFLDTLQLISNFY